MRHTVQRGCFEKEFRRLLREGSGAQRRAKDGLAAKEGRLSQTAPMIARILFPAAPPLAPDCPQVLIPLPRSTCAVTMLPNLGVSAPPAYAWWTPPSPRPPGIRFVTSEMTE